jgi:hypothetical protein
MLSDVMSGYRIRFRCFVVIVLACIFSSCRRSANSGGSLPDFFVVAPRATGVKQSVFQGHDQIIYHVQVDYPADNVLDEINGRLKQPGWEPLKEDFLNPGLPTTQVRGWTYFVDSTKKPSTSVHSWNGEWQNNSHDILNYILTYECPEELCSSSANLHDLRVVAIRIPADLAKRMQDSIPHDERHRSGQMR